MDTTFREQDIQITGVYFSKNQDRLRFESYPRRITYKGRQYSLIET